MIDGDQHMHAFSVIEQRRERGDLTAIQSGVTAETLASISSPHLGAGLTIDTAAELSAHGRVFVEANDG